MDNKQDFDRLEKSFQAEELKKIVKENIDNSNKDIIKLLKKLIKEDDDSLPKKK